MRANYKIYPKKAVITSKAEALDMLEASEEYREMVFREVAPDISVQAYACVIWTLKTRFGWGEKRIKQLVEALHDTDELMENPSRLHHRFDPLDCEREIKEKFGVDLRKEFPVRVEVQK